MATDFNRVGILSDLLEQAGVPSDGISIVDPNTVPPTVNPNYPATNTAEQNATGDGIIAAFDWRKRRKLSRNTVVAGLQSLTNAQRNNLLLHLLAQYFRDNPSVAAQVGTFLGTQVAVDEVDPT